MSLSEDELKTVIELDNEDALIAFIEKHGGDWLTEPVQNWFGCGGSYDISLDIMYCAAWAVHKNKLNSLRVFLRMEKCKIDHKCEHTDAYPNGRSALGFAVCLDNLKAIEMLYRGGASLSMHQDLKLEPGLRYDGSLLSLIQKMEHPEEDLNVQDLVSRFAGGLHRKRKENAKKWESSKGLKFLFHLHRSICARREEVLAWLLIFPHIGVAKDVGYLIARKHWGNRYSDFRDMVF